MRGMLVMTQDHCQAKEVVQDGVGLAAYQMDSHNCQRIVKDGMVKNEGNVEVDLGSKPYPVSYRAIVPKKEQADNLLVPVCLSATHIAYGSIRMEPVFMVLAQSAAVAASKAIDAGIAVQAVDVNKLNEELANNPLANRSIPEILANDNVKESFSAVGWRQESNLGNQYGLTYHVNDSTKKENNEAVFNATIKYAGKYQVYFFVPTLRKVFKNGQVATEAEIEIDKTAKIAFNPTENNGEWLACGTYTYNAGQQAIVKLKAKGRGLVAADAVLFVPVKE
jgi:hypothetical protein